MVCISNINSCAIKFKLDNSLIVLFVFIYIDTNKVKTELKPIILKTYIKIRKLVIIIYIITKYLKKSYKNALYNITLYNIICI